MATNSLQSLHHHSFLRRHHPDAAPAAALKPTNPNSLSFSLSNNNNTTTTTTTSANTMITFSSLSPSTTSSSSSSSQTPTTTTTTTTTTTSEPISFDLLHQHLQAQNFRQADEETRRLLIALAGEAAEKRGYVFFSEVQFIAEADLKAIDELWRQYSDNKFGYSVQKKIWEKVNKDFTKFFIRVGWMKKLDTEMEQYNYRAFPTEFIWENGKETPVGHLPLTNALRGTQLLASILNHPAFEGMQDDDDDNNKQEEEVSKFGGGDDNGVLKTKPLSKSVLKTDYSF